MRKFLDAVNDTDAKLNKGKLSIEEEQPIESWLEHLLLVSMIWLWVNENTL